MKTSCHNVSPRKSLLSLGATIAALPLFAADQTLTYAAGDTSIGDGVVEFTYDGDKITKIVSNVAKDDTVTLTGAALAFGTGATIETAGLGDLTAKGPGARIIVR